MKAKDVMTHCVVSIAPGASVLEAIARMISHQVSGMAVIDADSQLVGIVTEGDFLRRVETGTEAPRRRWLELLLGPGSRADEYARAHGRTVQDVMSRDVITVGKETPLREVVRLMEEHGVKRIPVIDDGRVAGIVSRADLMSMAKLYASEVAVKCANEGVQIHGGYGFIKDYPAEKFYRDVKLCTIGEGTSEIQRLVIARQLLKE